MFLEDLDGNRCRNIDLAGWHRLGGRASRVKGFRSAVEELNRKPHLVFADVEVQQIVWRRRGGNKFDGALEQASLDELPVSPV